MKGRGGKEVKGLVTDSMVSMVIVQCRKVHSIVKRNPIQSPDSQSYGITMTHSNIATRNR